VNTPAFSQPAITARKTGTWDRMASWEISSKKLLMSASSTQRHRDRWFS
jgi:hypothetical protein